MSGRKGMLHYSVEIKQEGEICICGDFDDWRDAKDRAN